MISVEEALHIIKTANKWLESEVVQLVEANGYVLAAHLLSPIDMPSFPQSAMDGYALNWIEGLTDYKLIGEVAAGSSADPILEPGEAVRIFTGAMVPSTANTIVQQEWTEKTAENVYLLRKVELGLNIRAQGEQIKQGDVALSLGDRLTPAGIGFLTSLGITEVRVFRQPKIAIITTGNELVTAGGQLKKGQIFESNSIMLSAALQQYNFHNHHIQSVSDNYEATKVMIENALQDANFLILTGGISVGDYDFVGKALAEIGVEELFYKVNQKPGKPLYFGKYDSKIVAALPGNPAAALTCFYRYVLPALNQMMGHGFFGLEEFDLPIGADYLKKGDRAEFLKALIYDEDVYILSNQSSAMLNSYAKANALIYLAADVREVKKYDRVKVLKL